MQVPAVPLSDDLVDRIAREIGNQVAFHIESQYPDAARAVAWDSAKLSIQGVVRNAVASAGRAAERGGIEKWIAQSKADRRRLKKLMRRSA